jgi:predicted RNA-binding protein Jag
MKSMLHEASSVLKAIEKAWVDSGKPLEFTIRILEQGEKNFLGMTKSPAIVSIAYDPNRQPKGFTKKEFEQPQKMKQVQVRQKFETRDGRGEVRPRQQIQGQNQRPPSMPEMRSQQQEDVWTADMVTDIKGLLKESMEHLGVATAYEVKVDRRVLQIMFDQNILASATDERQFFISLSYLLLQILKKKHKRKLRGYHLVINSKNYAATPADNQKV